MQYKKKQRNNNILFNPYFSFVYICVRTCIYVHINREKEMKISAGNFTMREH